MLAIRAIRAETSLLADDCPVQVWVVEPTAAAAAFVAAAVRLAAVELEAPVALATELAAWEMAAVALERAPERDEEREASAFWEAA